MSNFEYIDAIIEKQKQTKKDKQETIQALLEHIGRYEVKILEIHKEIEQIDLAISRLEKD